MRPFVRLIALSVQALLVMATAANAGQKVTIYTEDYPPYNYAAADGAIVGEATSRVVSIMAEVGLEYQIYLVPWARAYRLATTQANSLIYSIAYSEERQAQFDWLAKIARPAIYLYARRDLEIPVTLEAVRNGLLTALCVDTDASCPILRRFGFPEDKLIHSSPAGASEAMMVRYRRADIYLADLNLQPMKDYVYGEPMSDLRPTLKVDQNLEFYLAAGMQVDSGLREAVRQAYARLVSRGAITVFERTHDAAATLKP